MTLLPRIVAALVGVTTAVAAQQPLDVSNRMTRIVMVQFENSPDPATIGQSFGTPFQTVYSVQDGIGVLEISAASHREFRLEGYPPDAYGSFSPIVLEFDLATLEVTSQPASADIYYLIGAGLISEAHIAQSALGTDITAGVVSPDNEESYCSSQSYIDELCSEWFTFCGQTCSPVPDLGVPYDPDTGLVNLIGPETVQSCTRCCCGPSIEYFSRIGDLRITEIDSLQGLPNRPAAVIPAAAIVALVAGVVLVRMRHAALHQN